MFTEIRATNFKCWDRLQPSDPVAPEQGHDPEPSDVSDHLPGLRLGAVTGLFGINSSGKTSVLQILLLLKQTVDSPDRTLPLDLGDDRSPVDLGTFTDVLSHHRRTEHLGLGLSWKASEPIEVKDPTTEDRVLFTADNFSFDTSLSLRRESIEVDDLRYTADSNRVSLVRDSRTKPEYALRATVNGDPSYLKRALGRKWPLPAPVKCYGFPDQVSAYFQNAGFVSDLELSLEQQLKQTYYLGPLRHLPQRDYVWTGARPQDVGYSGAGAVPALLAAQLSGRRSNFRRLRADGRALKLITVEEHVAQWLRELGLLYSFRLAPLSEGANIYRVYVRQSEYSTEVLLTDIGFGVSQVLPVLVLLAYVPEGSTVVLEQPEIHLHPAVQAGLADVILESARLRNIQVIVESHSEHLLRRIQLRVAEQQLDNGTPIDSDLVKLWFIDQPDGTSRATDLRLSPLGEILNWPDNFFGDPFRETARIARAGLRRRRQESIDDSASSQI